MPLQVVYFLFTKQKNGYKKALPTGEAGSACMMINSWNFFHSGKTPLIE